MRAVDVDLISGRSTTKGHKEIREIERAEDKMKSKIRRAYEWVL